MIAIEHLTTTLDDATILSDVTLSVRGGETVALVGENGAGKTTLLRAVSGEIRPATGRVVVAGHDTTVEPKAVRRLVGWMPHEVGLHPELSPEEHLRVFGRLHGLSGPRLRGRVDELLRSTELQTRRRARTRTLSAGMLRRLSFGCALVHDPTVVLLDEPTDNMDAASRSRLGEMLSELCDRGACLLFATHDADEARDLADRVVHLAAGRVVASTDRSPEKQACSPTTRS